MSVFLRIAALVIFVIAAILAFVTTTATDSVLGWVSVGLAVWVASTVAPANLP